MDGLQPDAFLAVHPPPLDRLLSLGKPSGWQPEDWTEYCHEFDIGQQHVPDLVHLACDMALHRLPLESAASWAPVHAWRALGQLRAEAAAPALAALLIALDDDVAAVELPVVLGMIGPAAIPALAAQLAHEGHGLRASELPTALAEIGQRHPETRDRCIEVLVSILQGSVADRVLAGLTLSALIDLHAVESIAAIRDAFARDAIDLAMAGDLEDVEIELGLRTHRDTPQPRYVHWPALSKIADIEAAPWRPQTPVRAEKIGRNEPCPCGSGRKYKKCCLG